LIDFSSSEMHPTLRRGEGSKGGKEGEREEGREGGTEGERKGEGGSKGGKEGGRDRSVEGEIGKIHGGLVCHKYYSNLYHAQVRTQSCVVHCG